MLESKIETLTAAITQLIAVMSRDAAAPPVQAAPVPLVNVAAPVGTLPNGMPGGPFAVPAAAPAAAPAFAPPAAAGAPFTDLVGCTKYAVDSHQALEAKGPGRGEVITQIIQHLNGGNGSINDLPPAKYAEFYTIVEQQKAA